MDELKEYVITLLELEQDRLRTEINQVTDFERLIGMVRRWKPEELDMDDDSDKVIEEALNNEWKEQQKAQEGL